MSQLFRDAPFIVYSLRQLRSLFLQYSTLIKISGRWSQFDFVKRQNLRERYSKHSICTLEYIKQTQDQQSLTQEHSRPQEIKW